MNTLILSLALLIHSSLAHAEQKSQATDHSGQGGIALRTIVDSRTQRPYADARAFDPADATQSHSSGAKGGKEWDALHQKTMEKCVKKMATQFIRLLNYPDIEVVSAAPPRGNQGGQGRFSTGTPRRISFAAKDKDKNLFKGSVIVKFSPLLFGYKAGTGDHETIGYQCRIISIDKSLGNSFALKDQKGSFLGRVYRGNDRQHFLWLAKTK